MNNIIHNLKIIYFFLLNCKIFYIVKYRFHLFKIEGINFEASLIKRNLIFKVGNVIIYYF